MRTLPLLAALAAAATLSACATPAYVSPVEVTRFSDPSTATLGSGAIAVVPAPGTAADSWSFAAFRPAVAAELEKVGYRIAPESGNGAQTAEVSVDRYVMQANGQRSPVNVGVGGSTGSYGSGVGVGVGINLNSLSGPPADRIDTQLRVTIRPAGAGNALWEGRARFTATANSDFGTEQAAAQKLAGALFAGFPGASGETIEVR